MVDRNKKTRGSLKECSSWHPSPRGSLRELPSRLSPRGSLKEYSLRLSPRGSFKEMTGRITSPRGSMKEKTSSSKSPRESFKRSPIHLRPFGSLKESSSSPHSSRNLSQMSGIATSAMLVPLPLSWQIGGLSPLVSPILTAPITPPTPGSPKIPRIISTNWESLGCYDPYRYRRHRSLCSELYTPM